MTKPENPPAFPPAIACTATGGVYHGYDGMTLRDYAASAALTGLLANEQASPFGMSFNPDHLAARAYRIADAMLAERPK